MNLLKNVKVKIKLIVAFLVVAFFIGIVGGVGIVSLKNVGENAEKIYNENLRSVYILTDMKENLAEIKSDTIQLVYIKDSSKKAQLEKHIQENKDENDTYISEFEKLPMSDVEKNVYDILKGYLNKEQILSKNVINLVDAENFSEAEKQYLEIPKVSDTMFISLSKLIEKNLNDAELTNGNINYIYTTSKMTMIVLSIVGLIFAVLIGLILSNDINKPLQTIKLFGEKLANYDFSHEFNLKRGDEFGQTGTALFKAQNNIKELIKIIIENAQDTSASAEELSAIVEELSSKAINIDEAINTIANNMQEASAETEEVSASIQEVDSSINKLSQRAMEGSSNAIGGKERAIQVKNNSQEAIKETKKISVEKQNKMIKVIEDCKVVNNIKVMADTISSIAEETNLLALNAAIEAARAGDVGKGFAVVADEVRALAEQSADAVKNIRETIVKVQGAFKNSIETGNDILQFISKDVHTQFIEYEKTGNQYYDDSDFVSKMSGDIAAMSEEVTATVGHVREAVQNMAGTARKSGEQAETIKEGMNETTQALKQVALTAQSQAELAQKLNEIVQKFNI